MGEPRREPTVRNGEQKEHAIQVKSRALFSGGQDSPRPHDSGMRHLDPLGGRVHTNCSHRSSQKRS